MTPTTAAQSASRGKREESNLDRRYGEIGISAVAAAVRYQSEAKNLAYAPAALQYEKWVLRTEAA